jgi:hypothetical protein
MNSSFIDNMEGNALACSPTNGDEGYWLVCFYITRILGPLLCLIALSSFYVAYLQVMHYKWATSTTSGVASIGPNISSKHRKISHMPQVPSQSTQPGSAGNSTKRRKPSLYGAQSAALIGTGIVSVSLSFMISGGGTAFPTDDWRGILGDLFCE